MQCRQMSVGENIFGPALYGMRSRGRGNKDEGISNSNLE